MDGVELFRVFNIRPEISSHQLRRFVPSFKRRILSETRRIKSQQLFEWQPCQRLSEESSPQPVRTLRWSLKLGVHGPAAGQVHRGDPPDVCVSDLF